MEESEVVSKRPREEPSQVKEDLDYDEESSKRHKSYNHILSLLELEEEDSTQDLSPLITTLQQEITCACDSDNKPQTNGLQNITTASDIEDCFTSTNFCKDMVKEDDKERVMRHLLEASDDDLGIPNKGDDGLVDFSDDGLKGGDMFTSMCDGLWEFEDETANYYALLQSQLFF